MMKKKYSLVGVVGVLLSFGLFVNPASALEECNNPAACLRCHTENDLVGEDLGCDRGKWEPTAPLNLARDLADKTVSLKMGGFW